jgi:hypothetical protein
MPPHYPQEFAVSDARSKAVSVSSCSVSTATANNQVSRSLCKSAIMHQLSAINTTVQLNTYQIPPIGKYRPLAPT